MSRLFPEVGDGEASEPAAPRVPSLSRAEAFHAAELDVIPASPPAGEGPTRPPGHARGLLERMLGLPGRFRSGGACRVLSVSHVEDDAICVELEGGGIRRVTLELRRGSVEPSFARTSHLSIRSLGTDAYPALEALLRHVHFRLTEAPFELLSRVVLRDPDVAATRVPEGGLPMPHMHWPPTDVDVEYLESLGFGYSPPGAWRNFFQGHENSYAGIENARGYCQRIVGDVVRVNHTEIECFMSAPPQQDGSVAFWNHLARDGRDVRARHGSDLFSDLDELDVIKGGTPKLDRLLAALGRGERPAPDLLVISNTCTATVIGDDTDGSLERAKRRLPLRAVNANESRDIPKALLDRARRDPAFFAVARRPRSINLVGMPRMLGHDALLALLRASGVELNAWLLPDIDPQQIARYMAAEVQVLYDWPFLDASYQALVGDLPLPTVRPRAPFGVEGTRRFLAGLAEALGEPTLFDAAFERAYERIAPRWESLSREARGYRVGFVGEERTLQRFFSTRQLLGIPVLHFLEEMGFSIDLFVTRTRGDRPEARVVEQGRRRTTYFASPEELEELLRSQETAAIYSELYFDRRLTRSGKNPFSIRELGRIGLDGALDALGKMIGACRMPFFRTYARYLAPPFQVGHDGGGRAKAEGGQGE